MKKTEKTKPKQEKLKKEGMGKGKKRSIRNTLMGAFVLPVFLMIILGVVSYNIASNVVLSQYKESASSTVGAVADYMNLVCDTISGKAMEMVTNDDIKEYYTIHYNKNTAEAVVALKEARETILNIPTTNKKIYSGSVISERGKSLTSVTSTIEGNAYEEFAKTPEGKYLSENKAIRNGWLGYHTYLDTITKTDAERYCITYYQKLSSPNDILILDVNMSVFEEMMESMDLGEGSIKAMISGDGREIVRIQGTEEPV